MLNRFVSIRDDLILDSENSDASIPVDSSAEFMMKVKKSQNMLDKINAVAEKLQTRKRTLAACRGDIAHLRFKVANAKQKPIWKL